ncbi:MAG: MFS family permease [Gammaproteobacteria bacterium]|jgi:MFS family permease
MASPGFQQIITTLRLRNFRIYLCGNVISMIGLWTQRIAVGWLTWELTHSGAWLGVIAFADLFPALVVGPFAGVLADRVDRLKIMRVSQILSMAQAGLLALLAINGTITIWMLFALVLANGVISSVNQPARLAVISSLVPRAHLSSAIALNSISFNLARFIGPALAGALILSIGVGAAFAVNAVSFLAFLVALAMIDVQDTRPGNERGERKSVLRDLGEGLAYVRHHPTIGPLLLLSTATGVGLRCFVELLPGFAAQVFERGAEGLAALGSAIGVGAIIGGVWIAQRNTSSSFARIALIASLCTALSVLAFAATDDFWIALVCATAFGMFMSVSGIAVQTTVQMRADSHVRGRTLSVYGLITRASPATGALILGAASEVAGLRLPLVLAAIACLLVWLIVWQRRATIDPN